MLWEETDQSGSFWFTKAAAKKEKMGVGDRNLTPTLLGVLTYLEVNGFVSAPTLVPNHQASKSGPTIYDWWVLRHYLNYLTSLSFKAYNAKWASLMTPSLQLGGLEELMQENPLE